MKPEMKALFDKLLAGEEVEFAYTNGLVRSSKTAFKVADGIFQINHDIDGSVSSFSQKGIEEVFNDERSAWEGDLNDEEDDEIEDDGNLKCPGCGYLYAHLYYVSGCTAEEAICFECFEEAFGIHPEDDDVAFVLSGAPTVICEEIEGDATEWIVVGNVGGYEQDGYVYVGESA